MGFPKGRITFDEETCLWRCMPVLKREMDCGQVMKELVRRNVLDEKDQRLIRSRPTNSEKNTVLIDIIMNRTSAGFEAFVHSLKDSGHKVAHQTLLETLAKESKETARKLMEGSGPMELTTGAEFHDNLPEHVPKASSDDDDDEKPVRRPRRPLGELEPADSAERSALKGDGETDLKRALDAAKEKSGRRGDPANGGRKDAKHVDQLSQMVKDSKEKIARLLAENRNLKKDLDQEHDKAQKEIKRLKEQIKSTPRPSSRSESEDRKSSSMLLQNLRRDGHDLEVVRQMRKMKAEILQEIKQERNKEKEQALPTIEPPKTRRMSNPPPPKAEAPVLLSSPLPVLLVPTPGLNKNDAWTKTLQSTWNEPAVPKLDKATKTEQIPPRVPRPNENITTDWDDVPMADLSPRRSWHDAPAPYRGERPAPKTQMSDPNSWLHRTEDNPMLYQHLKRSRPKKKTPRRNPVLNDGYLEDRHHNSHVEHRFRWTLDHQGKRMLTGFLSHRGDPYGKTTKDRCLVLREV